MILIEDLLQCVRIPFLASGDQFRFVMIHPVTPGCSGLQAGEEWNVENIKSSKEAPSFRAGSNGVHWTFTFLDEK
jgi:hypothetical protein